MAKLGEGLRNLGGAALDSIGVTGFRVGWKEARKDYHGPLPVPVAAGTGVLLGVEEIISPNSTRDFIIDDSVSTHSEYLKSRAALAASGILDALTFAGAVGVGLLTKQLEAAIATKIGLNAATSAVVRTADSIGRRRAVTV